MKTKHLVCYHCNLGVPFEHRAAKIRKLAGSSSPAILCELIHAFLVEPDHAMKKLIALQILQARASGARNVINHHVLDEVGRALSWTLFA